MAFLTVDQLEQMLELLGDVPDEPVMANATGATFIEVGGYVYREANGIDEKLLALSLEMQDYDIPDLAKWTDLSNRMLAALDLGKDSIQEGGNDITAQQLYDTLVRVFNKTQQHHQQMWNEKERERKKRLEQMKLKSPSWKTPEFYREQRHMEPLSPEYEGKPGPTELLGKAVAPSTVVFRGAEYKLVGDA